jgi:hypothetical protein
MKPAQYHILARPLEVLRTLVDIAVNIPPTTEAYPPEEISRNLAWLCATVHLGGFIDRFERVRLSEEERQLLARLHTMYGLTDDDVRESSVVESRAFVYDMRKYGRRNGFGPFQRLDVRECGIITLT